VLDDSHCYRLKKSGAYPDWSGLGLVLDTVALALWFQAFLALTLALWYKALALVLAL